MTEGPKDVSVEEFQDTLEYVLKNAYKTRDADAMSETMLNNCLKLFAKDYKCLIVNNDGGELCSHYPSKIIIMEYLISDSGKPHEKVESLYDAHEVKDLFNKAKFARCRGRFSVPVMLFEGKHICRSATISGGVELYGRSGFDFFLTGGENIPDGEGNAQCEDASAGGENWLFNRIRGQDIRLLKKFSIGYICDLMVEKKKVKFGMNVTSSEKVDKENRYADFTIFSVPYPGCEFFKEWRDNGYMAEGMMFDWRQGYVDARLELPGRLSPPHMIDWSNYRHWDLVRLTQNYLKLLLHYVKEGDSGLLIHCISGWDRTPLFISLLRLSLWAEGAVHPNLSPVEILYLTIAYDWYLFGHNFPDRISKGEEIFFFCFNFLKYITSDDFNIYRRKRHKSRTVSRTDSECNFDGVLLEPEISRASYRGSNTSINSTSSLNSTKSSIDNAPIFFTTSHEEEPCTLLPNGNVNYHNGAAVTAQSKSVIEPMTMRSGQSPSSQVFYSSTSPVAVPHSVQQRVQDAHTNSPVYGSWQIVSGSGSFRGSTSSTESPHSSASDPTGNPQTDSSSTLVLEEPTRKQKLDAARRVFLSVYCNVIDYRTFKESSGLSSLVGQFAEKVGIRAPRSTPV